jgi:hypothetical protein
MNPLNIGPNEGRELLRSNGNLAADHSELARQLKNRELPPVYTAPAIVTGAYGATAELT